jgi:hypothetical protein
MEGKNHIEAVQATGSFGREANIWDRAAEEQGAAEAAAKAEQQQQEQAIEHRNKMNKLADAILGAIDQEGRIQVETDSW